MTLHHKTNKRDEDTFPVATGLGPRFAYDYAKPRADALRAEIEGERK